MNYDDPSTDAYYDRKLADDLKWQAEQARRKGYWKVEKALWAAYEAILEEAHLEDEKAKEGKSY